MCQSCVHVRYEYVNDLEMSVLHSHVDGEDGLVVVMALEIFFSHVCLVIEIVILMNGV